MIPRAVTVLVLLLVAVIAPVVTAHATTVVAVPDGDLVAGASEIVVARVASMRSVWDARSRRVFTDVTIVVDEVLAGEAPARSVTVRLPGGRVGALDVSVQGAPQFRTGERALLFLGRGADGRFRVSHLFQGKFSVVTSELTGEEVALRVADAGVNVVGGAAAARLRTGDVRRLDDLRRLVRQLRAGGPRRSSAAATTAEGDETQSSAEYTFLGSPSRWFEPDSGQSVSMWLDDSGEPLAATRGYDQARDGYAAWNAVPGSAFRFRHAGFTTPRGAAFDGVNAISFRDPLGQIDPPSSCAGTLAVTVVYRSTTEARVVNGQSFFRVLEADVVVADGWQGCGFYESETNLAEVMTHELGHVLGLGHSGDDNATMAAFAHFDGRGASLTADDEAGVRFAYPVPTVATLTVTRSGTGSGTVTSSPGGITCGSDCSETYPSGTFVTITPTAAPGSVFVGWAGVCAGFSDCVLRIPRDTSLEAVFDIAPVSFDFTTPAPSATVSGNVTVGFRASGGSGGYSYRITVGANDTVYSGPATSFTWNTTAYPDGAHILVGTVTDSAGRSTGNSRLVRIANSGSFTASITYPGEGATVRNSVRVGMSTTAPWGEAKTWVLFADGVEVLRTAHTGTTLWSTWDTTRTPNGTRTLRLEVTNASGQTAAATRSVTVANATSGTPPPPPPLTASFTAPAAGATMTGTATVGMSAGGTSGPVTFILTVDGAELSRQSVSGTTATYSWNTTSIPDGSHTLGLTVTDGAGRTATASRTVTVSNAAPPPTAPFTASFQYPANGATVSGNKSVGMATSAPWGESKTWVLTRGGVEIMRRTTTGTTLWWTWDTTTSPNGDHELVLAVTDSSNRTATARIAVRISN